MSQRTSAYRWYAGLPSHKPLAPPVACNRFRLRSSVIRTSGDNIAARWIGIIAQGGTAWPFRITPSHRGRAFVRREPQGRMVGRDQAGRLDPRAHRGAYRPGHHRLRQRVHRRAPGAGRPEGARAALSRRERAEPERVSEKLHQNTFWMGRGGTLTHTISGIDIALWDILGQATGLSVGRLLGGGLPQARAALLLAADGRAEGDARRRRRSIASRASGLQDRLGAVRPGARRQARRGDRARGARGGGRRHRSCSSTPARAMPSGRTASNGRCAPPRCSRTIDVGWFEEPLRPDAIDDYLRAAPRSARCRSPAARC